MTSFTKQPCFIGCFSSRTLRPFHPWVVLCRVLHLALQRRDVVDAVILRSLAHELAVPPFAQHPADILARHSRHRREIPVADLVVERHAA